MATAATGCSVAISAGVNTDPGLASMANGPLDVFHANLTENLLRIQVDPRTNTVTRFQNLGGVVRSEPGAVSWGAGHSAVFVKGSDGAL